MLFWLASEAAAMDVLKHSTGLRTAVWGTDGETVDISLALAVGSANDPAGTEGIAHIVEHLWFDAIIDEERVSDRHFRLGCRDNAFTEAEVTTYIASCPAVALGELLAETAQVFHPWNLTEGAVAAAARVVVHEEYRRAESSDDVEYTSFVRQLLPASHPERLRATRPALGSLPTLPQIQAFVATHYRADRAALAIIGGVETKAIPRTLDIYFGGSKAVTSLGPVVVAPVARQALRLAPRLVPEVAISPSVFVGWSLPELGMAGGEVVEGLLGQVLSAWLAEDSGVVDFGCGSMRNLFSSPFYCRIRTVDDAAATRIGSEVAAQFAGTVPAVMKLMGKDLAKAMDERRILWGLLALGRHAPTPSALPSLVARGLLDGWEATGERNPTPLAKLVNNANLSDTALVVVMSGRTRPLVATAPMPPDIGLGEPPMIQVIAPVPADSPVVATRTLPNGVTLLAVQRSGDFLVTASISAPTDGSTAARWVSHGAQRSAWDDSYSDVVTIHRFEGARWGATFAGAPRLLPAIGGLLLRHLTAFHFDTGQAMRRVTWKAKVQAGLPIMAAQQLITMPAMAMVDHWGDGDELDPLTLDPAANLRAVMSMFRPSETQVAVVSGLPPEVALDMLAPSLADWKPNARAAPTITRLTKFPRGTFVSLETLTAGVTLACPIDAAGGAATVLQGLVADRLRVEVRERRAWTYSPSVWISSGVLNAYVQTEPARAEDVLVLTKAALSAPSAAELSRAKAAAIWDSPVRWPAEDLALSLASGTVTLDQVTEWNSDIEALNVTSAADTLKACHAGISWLVSGPPSTRVPANAVSLSFSEVKALLQNE